MRACPLQPGDRNEGENERDNENHEDGSFAWVQAVVRR